MLMLLALAQLHSPYMVERPTQAPSTTDDSEEGETWCWKALGETIAFMYPLGGGWMAWFTSHHLLPMGLTCAEPHPAEAPFKNREAAAAWVEERLVNAGFQLVSVPEPVATHVVKNFSIMEGEEPLSGP